MVSTGKFGDLVVACSMCTASVFITNKDYTKVLHTIETKTLTNVLFRTSVCAHCERKVSDNMSMLLGVPGRGNVVPIGTSMVTNWPAYKNVSMYVGKYCKLYNSDDSDMHAIENRFDVLSTVNSKWYMYDVYSDSTIYIAQESGSRFFGSE